MTGNTLAWTAIRRILCLRAMAMVCRDDRTKLKRIEKTVLSLLQTFLSLTLQSQKPRDITYEPISN